MRLLTVACLQVNGELISWTTETLIAISQVDTDVITAVVHCGARILSCRETTWRQVANRFRTAALEMFTCQRLTFTRLPIRVESEAFPAHAPVGGGTAHT